MMVEADVFLMVRIAGMRAAMQWEGAVGTSRPQ
jgi:hypothetical protein